LISNPSLYSTLIFDCDGVVLNSNVIKTEAFYSTALSWGESAADELVSYHISHGGISRYQKFHYFLTTILPRHYPGAVPGLDGPAFDDLLLSYSSAVRSRMLTCDIAEGLESFRSTTANIPWLIVSGGDQDELRDIFTTRGISSLFDGGIFGSPDTKDIILEREFRLGHIEKPALFLGDSRYDYEASSKAGVDFVFVSCWTEMPDWRLFVSGNEIASVQNISDLSCIC